MLWRLSLLYLLSLLDAMETIATLLSLLDAMETIATLLTPFTRCYGDYRYFTLLPLLDAMETIATLLYSLY